MVESGITLLGMSFFPAFLPQPEGNGCIEPSSHAGEAAVASASFLDC